MDDSEEDVFFKFYENTSEKDINDAIKKISLKDYTYLPKIEEGKAVSMQILAGKKQLVKASAGDTFEKVWLVHPLEKLQDRSGLSRIDRSVPAVIGKTYTRAKSPFVDINADGKLEAIVGHFSGGAHCCMDYTIYSLNKPKQVYAKIDARDGNFSFADLDGDRKYEAIGADFTFGYWNTSFAGSPAATVILKPGPHGLSLATQLMRTPKPTSAQMNKLIKETSNALTETKLKEPEQGADFQLVPVLWKNMLDLIYAGHSDDAWNLLNKSWPQNGKALFTVNPDDEKTFGAHGAAEFKQAFLTQLKKSPYWSGLVSLNNSDPQLGGSSASKGKTRSVLVGDTLECQTERKMPANNP